MPLRDGQAEQRLMQMLAPTSAGLTQQALPLAEDLVRDYPNFQLAQLALGDLLLAQAGQCYLGQHHRPDQRST